VVSAVFLGRDKIYYIPEEPVMTNEERLVKAASATLETWTTLMPDWRSRTNGTVGPALLELEAAVKACEAAVPDKCDPLRSWFYSTDPPPIAPEHLSLTPPTLTALTDEQRKLGLRSTRHMGPDWENYDYD